MNCAIELAVQISLGEVSAMEMPSVLHTECEDESNDGPWRDGGKGVCQVIAWFLTMAACAESCFECSKAP